MRPWTLLASLLLFSASAQADTLFGIYAGYGSWHHDSTGGFSSGQTVVDLEEDLALGDDQDDVYYLALEHGIPFLPNIRAQHSSVGSTSDIEIGRQIDFNGFTALPPAALSSDISINQTDAILYYQLLDNVVSLDLGLGAREISGSIDLSTSLASTSVDFDETIPLVYAAFRFDMLNGYWIAAEAQGMAYEDNQLIDGAVKLGWESPWGIGLEAGFRWLDLELEEVSEITEANIEFQGPYAALNYHF